MGLLREPTAAPSGTQMEQDEVQFRNDLMSLGMPMSVCLRFAMVMALGVAFALTASLMGSPASAQALPVKPELLQHAAKSKKAARSVTLRPLPAGQAVAARKGPISPYERAAAQRTQSGEPPPGHPVVRRQAAPVPN
jgi:hypothetical protein